mgnify:CR=1 FL=1
MLSTRARLTKSDTPVMSSFLNDNGMLRLEKQISACYNTITFMKHLPLTRLFKSASVSIF